MNRTVYINKTNEAAVADLDGSLSGLINDLLTDYFNLPNPGERLDSTPPMEVVRMEDVKEPDSIIPQSTPVKKVSLTEIESTARAIEKAIPHCKVHGIPLDLRGKCLQKGCKYA